MGENSVSALAHKFLLPYRAKLYCVLCIVYCVLYWVSVLEHHLYCLGLELCKNVYNLASDAEKFVL